MAVVIMILESNWKQQVAEMHEKDAGSNLSQFSHFPELFDQSIYVK